MIPREIDQFRDAARRHGLDPETVHGGISILCPRCMNGQRVCLDDSLGIVMASCNYCGASSIAIAWALGDLDKAKNGHPETPIPNPVPTPSRLRHRCREVEQLP